MHAKQFNTLIVLMFIAAAGDAIAAPETNALATSGFIGLSYSDDQGKLVNTCSGKKASFAQNYVSIGIEQLTVNKSDNLITRIVNRNRSVFSAADITGTYNSQKISVSKVGKPVALSGAESIVDMGVQWGMLDRAPWVLKDAGFNIRLGYSADSTTDAIVQAFNGITAGIPAYSVSTSVSAGIAITQAVDKLLFAPDRTVDLLRAHRDLPLMAGQLCEGYYAVFSAENKITYQKYQNGSVAWTGNILSHQNNPINDVTYAIISVKVSDRFYPNTEASFNDRTKAWASKYSDVISNLWQLGFTASEAETDSLEKQIQTSLNDARTLLMADQDLILNEKKEIHGYAMKEASDTLASVKKRFDSSKKITQASTESVVNLLANKISPLINPATQASAELILNDPVNNIPTIKDSAVIKLKSSIDRMDSLLRFK